MIIPDKKKMATAVVANLGKPEEAEEEGGDSFEAIADQILSAVSSGSAGELADALRAFHSECEMDSEG